MLGANVACSAYKGVDLPSGKIHTLIRTASDPGTMFHVNVKAGTRYYIGLLFQHRMLLSLNTLLFAFKKHNIQLKQRILLLA